MTTRGTEHSGPSPVPQSDVEPRWALAERSDSYHPAQGGSGVPPLPESLQSLIPELMLFDMRCCTY